MYQHIKKLALVTLMGSSLCATSYAEQVMTEKLPVVQDLGPSYEEARDKTHTYDDDPIEPVNRVIYGFNQISDALLIGPIARFYQMTVPQPLQNGVHNFVDNWAAPLTMLNQVLQGKGEAFQATTGRFMINTVLGVLGIFDVATAIGIEAPPIQTFSYTLGTWGLPAGPYLVLPLLGPSSPRDVVGRVVDYVADPVSYTFHHMDKDAVLYYRWGATLLVLRVDTIELYDDLYRNSTDMYAAVRSMYTQNVAAHIRGGEVDLEDSPSPSSGSGLTDAEEAEITPVP